MPLANARPSKLTPIREDEKPVKKDVGPHIPSEVLTKFLEEKLTLGEAAKINQVARHYLWNEINTEYWRINVWAKDSSAKSFCPSRYVLRSFFVCYDREFSVITDKTI
jgi:hypothetical protein